MEDNTRRWCRAEYDRLIELGMFIGERLALPSTAALIVEVAEAGLRLDRRLKAGLHARAGLPEYWIVNLVDRSLEVHRGPGISPAGDARYRSVTVLRPPAAVTPLGAPHATIAVADLFLT